MNQENTHNEILAKTFKWMFFGLLISAIIAWHTNSSYLYQEIVMKGYFPILLIVEVGVVILFSRLIKHISPLAAGILYIVYAIINGLTLSVIFSLYELTSITSIFVTSAIIFAILAILGYTTEKDFTKWGSYITTFLIFGIALSLFNFLIFKSDALSIIIDWTILLTFMIATIQDLNRIKKIANINYYDKEKVHIYLALTLYLDFINMFFRILSIFGKKK